MKYLQLLLASCFLSLIANAQQKIVLKFEETPTPITFQNAEIQTSLIGGSLHIEAKSSVDTLTINMPHYISSTGKKIDSYKNADNFQFDANQTAVITLRHGGSIYSSVFRYQTLESVLPKIKTSSYNLTLVNNDKDKSLDIKCGDSTFIRKVQNNVSLNDLGTLTILPSSVIQLSLLSENAAPKTIQLGEESDNATQSKRTRNRH